TTNEDKTATLTPLNNNPIQSNTIRLASFTVSTSSIAWSNENVVKLTTVFQGQ
ncbi:unnamed protein product, partial [Rotaria magnacalcarata]